MTSSNSEPSNRGKPRSAARVYGRPRMADLARYRIWLILAVIALALLVVFLIYWLRR